jgi:hypothetical protein
MTATIEAPVRFRPPHAALAVSARAARRLRIELRRNTVPWILPLIAALFWFDSYRPSTSQTPIWVLRTFWNLGQGHTIIDFGPFVAGVAAWIASRDGRRGTADIVTAAAGPRWTAQLTTWAATAIWAVGAYLAFVGVLFGVYASQGMHGSPPWWWVAVGAAAVIAFSTAGFALGAAFPSRFTAPLAAFGGSFAMALSSQTSFSHSRGWALILPTNSNGNYQPVSGIFYPYLPDLPIARVMFLAGIAAAILGLLGVPVRAGGPRLRLVAAILTLTGVAAAGTAVRLTATSQLGPHGIVIPMLHDAANDRPISYTPVCGKAAAVPVCLNPAYRTDLPTVTAALTPVFTEVHGLPGAPERATQIGGTYSSGEGEAGQAMTISGSPPALVMPLDAEGIVGAFGETTTELGQQLQLLSVHAFVGAGTGIGTEAQQAVQAALLQGAGAPFTEQPKMLFFDGLPSWAQATRGAADATGRHPEPALAVGPIYTAAERLAALPRASRHAWLAAHLPALRSGQLTLAQLP